MIKVLLRGGLGNQMFQWAYGRSLSHKNNLTLYLDQYFLKNTAFGDTKRSFALANFENLSYHFSEDIPIIKPKVIGEDLTKINTQLESDKDYVLDGFFQDYRYFSDVSEIIREDFSFSKEIISKFEIPNNSTSVHIRRTDYLTSNGFHPILPLEYYEKSLDIIERLDKILIFSDDIRWCKENLKFKNMIFVENTSNYEDLYIMSQCKNNICANSSFSWWGAWLNKNNEKKVILPRKWFADHISYDLNNSPIEWIRI